MNAFFLIQKKKKNTLAIISIIAIIAILLLFASCETSNDIIEVDIPTESYSSFGTGTDTTLRGYVLNVEQASCLVLESSGVYAVIDTGGKGSASYVYSAISNPKYIGTKRIEYLFFTHYDLDHIGAGSALVQKLNVGSVYGPTAPKEKTREYSSLVSSCTKKGKKIRCPNLGQEFVLGDCTIRVIAPDPSLKTDDVNEKSIALLIEDDYNNTLYVGGDSGALSEEKQLSYLKDKRISVYIVNHHGAASSSSELFINSIKPQTSIISCSKDNSYKHPSEDTLKRLRSVSSEIKFTYDVQKGENLSFVFSEKGVEFNH